MSERSAGVGQIQATWPEFQPVLDSDLDAQEALLNAITDVPSGRPKVELPITEAGILDQKATLTIPNFIRPTETVVANGTVRVSCELRPDRRGAHMSRFVELVNALSAERWAGVADFISALAEKAATTQGSPSARAMFQGDVVIQRPTRVTQRPSPGLPDIVDAGSARGDPSRPINFAKQGVTVRRTENSEPVQATQARSDETMCLNKF